MLFGLLDRSTVVDRLAFFPARRCGTGDGARELMAGGTLLLGCFSGSRSFARLAEDGFGVDSEERSIFSGGPGSEAGPGTAARE